MTTQTSTVPRAWWYVLKLITFRPGMYLISSFGILSFYLWPLLPGLFIRQIFDVITQGAPDNDILLIIHGSGGIEVNRWRDVATRAAGTRRSV